VLAQPEEIADQEQQYGNGCQVLQREELKCRAVEIFAKEVIHKRILKGEVV
jgi:hypothetical protein